jgi:hypothetical protein
MSLLPRAEHEIARRLVQIESRYGVMVWNPQVSASGDWEAAGDGWQIIEASLASFMLRLERQLAVQDQQQAQQPKK